MLPSADRTFKEKKYFSYHRFNNIPMLFTDSQKKTDGFLQNFQFSLDCLVLFDFVPFLKLHS